MSEQNAKRQLSSVDASMGVVDGAALMLTDSVTNQSTQPFVCRDFHAGACERGDTCRFTHDMDAVVAESSAPSKPEDEKGHPKKANASRKRVRERDAIKDDDKLCPSINRGAECKFGDRCTFTHDTMAFLARKPSDIDSVCVQYNIYGECPNGFSCRFGDSHIDRSAGRLLTNMTGMERITINQLSQELKVQLRKKKYDFRSASGTDTSAYPTKEVKLVDFSNKVYIAPLTTVGNLPFRRILKDFGADITCSEMTMGLNLLQGQVSEWALVRRHSSEETFGIQLAGSVPDQMAKVAKLIENETSSDFVDLNCGCPIDLLCNQGCGAAMMNKPTKLVDVVSSMGKNLNRSITVKIRIGWDEKHPNAHKIIPQIQKLQCSNKIAAVMIHGRSRLQRYTKLADWNYVLSAAQSQDPTLRALPVIGNGDIM